MIKPSFLDGLLLTSMTGNLTRCLILTRKACGLVWTVTLVSSPSPRRYVRSASLVFHSSESVWHNALSVTADDAIQLLTTGKASKILLRMHFSQKLTHSKSIITYCLRLFIWMTERCLDQSLGHFKPFKLHLTVIQKWNAGPPYKVSQACWRIPTTTAQWKNRSILVHVLSAALHFPASALTVTWPLTK